MSQHLNGSHRRSGDSNSRERQPRNASLNAANSNTVNNSVGGGADYASTNDRQSRSRANNKSNENQIKEAIIDLYLKVKIRSNDEVSQSDNLNSFWSQNVLLSVTHTLWPHLRGFTPSYLSLVSLPGCVTLSSSPHKGSKTELSHSFKSSFFCFVWNQLSEEKKNRSC